MPKAMQWNDFLAATAVLALLAPLAAPTQAAETKTAKERLVSKAADEQRVDNCNVPPELWGPVKRPGCPTQETASFPAAEPGPADGKAPTTSQ